MGRAWVFGDVYKYSDDQNTDNVVSMIASKWQTGDIVVLAGDCLQEDPPTTTKYNALIVAVFDALGIDETNRTQVLAVPGNHDYDRSAFSSAFGFTGDLWSSHVINGARWILLDSMNAAVDQYNPGVNAAQLTWLDGQLAAPFNGPTYAVMHHPRKSSYTQTSPDSYNNNTVLDSLYSRLYGAGVDYVFHGHVPFFEITKKVDHGWYLKSDGFRQVGTGTGGWSHQASSSSNNSLMNASDGSGTVVIGQHFNNSPGGAYGATLATWDSTTTTVEYFSTDGVARYTLTNDPLNNPGTGGTGGGQVSTAAVGIASAQGTTGVTINTSGIKGTGRYGLLALSWNGPSHNGGIIGMPTIPGGWTEVQKGAGVNFTPGVGVWWGPLETVDSVVVGSSPATVHMSGAVVAFNEMDTPTSTARASGYAITASGTFPDVTDTGGWLALCGINTNTRTASFNLAHQQTYESTQYSGATVFAGSVPSGGWSSQLGQFTISSTDNYATLFVTFNDPAQTNYVWTDLGDVIVEGTVVGAGVGTDITSTDINGVDNLQGQPVTYDDRWDITPSVPPSVSWPFRVTLPADYPVDQGYHAYIRLHDDADDSPIGPEVTCTNASGDLGIIGGETVAVFSPTVTATTPGATTVYARIRLVPDTAANVRPTGGGAVGRLARPRMVELWRSQGGGGTPTLTTADRYVDPTNGNDGNNGLTRGTAWRTMAHAFTQTSGLGVGIGYMSGNLGYFARDGGAGNGTNFTNRMNTHYVLSGETCTVNGNWFNDSAIHIKHMSYLQFSGFTMLNTQNGDGGADYAGAIQVDDIPDQNTSHHIIWADIKGTLFNGSAINGYGVRFARVLGCEIYDCGWWHNSGGSGMTFNNIDASTPGDTTPAGYVNGQPIDLWIEACYVTGSRQKVDSAGIGYPGEIVDGNGIIVDYNVNGPAIRAAIINCITHNTGQRGIHTFQGCTEFWVVNCASFYSGRHRVYVATPGDPIYQKSPKSCWEIQAAAYDGRQITAHFWNNVAVCGNWMTTADRAFGLDGPNVTLDAQNNKRHNAPVADGYSSDMTDPLVVNSSLVGTTFDPRPTSGSPMLSGGNLALLNLTGVTTDFAGNSVAASGSGHVGPYSIPT